MVLLIGFLYHQVHDEPRRDRTSTLVTSPTSGGTAPTIGGNTGSKGSDRQSPHRAPGLWFFILIVPISGFIVSRALFMHDSIMSMLHLYMIDCERKFNVGSEEPGGETMPSFHFPNRVRGPNNVEKFLLARKIQDVSLVRIVLGGSISALLIAGPQALAAEGTADYVINIFFIVFFLLSLANSLYVLGDARDIRVKAVSGYVRRPKAATGNVVPGKYAEIFVPLLSARSLLSDIRILPPRYDRIWRTRARDRLIDNFSGWWSRAIDKLNKYIKIKK
jgi:hypothetical protein